MRSDVSSGADDRGAGQRVSIVIDSGRVGADGPNRSACETRRRPRLLTGRGRYVDDVTVPRMVHAAFVRSAPCPPALTRVNLDRARGRRVSSAYSAAPGASTPARALSPAALRRGASRRGAEQGRHLAIPRRRTSDCCRRDREHDRSHRARSRTRSSRGATPQSRAPRRSSVTSAPRSRPGPADRQGTWRHRAGAARRERRRVRKVYHVWAPPTVCIVDPARADWSDAPLGPDPGIVRKDASLSRPY